MLVHCAELKRVLSVSDALLQKTVVYSIAALSVQPLSQGWDTQGQKHNSVQVRAYLSLMPTMSHLQISPSAPPYLPATVLSIGLSFLGDRIKWRGPLVLMIIPLAMIGESLHLERSTLAYSKLGYLILVVAHVRHPRFRL